MTDKTASVLLRPSWSFICETVVTDMRTKRMSYINQFDDVYYQHAPETFENNEYRLVPLPFHIALNWSWDCDGLTADERQHNSPSTATVRFVNPQGSLLVTENNIPFVQTRMNERGFVGAIQVVNFPVLGWGEYTITITPNGHEASVNKVSLSILRRESSSHVKAKKTRKKKPKATKIR